MSGASTPRQTWSTFRPSWRGGRHEIDHAGARAELDEPDCLEPPLLAEAEHARVEVERPRLVAAADDDVVDLRDPERAVHGRAQPTPARASFASSARVRSTASPSPGTANGAARKSVAPASARRRSCSPTAPSSPTMATSAGPSTPSRSSMARYEGSAP